MSIGNSPETFSLEVSSFYELENALKKYVSETSMGVTFREESPAMSDQIGGSGTLETRWGTVDINYDHAKGIAEFSYEDSSGPHSALNRHVENIGELLEEH